MFFIEDHLADRVGFYVSADGILHADNTAADIRLDLASLEGKVAILARAVLKNEIFAIAERLCALYVTTDKTEILGIPAEILTFDNAVVNGDVFRVPESVLGLEMRVSDLHVLDVLKGILSRHGEIKDFHIFALKEGIHRLQLNTRNLNVITSPSELLAVDVTT